MIEGGCCGSREPLVVVCSVSLGVDSELKEVLWSRGASSGVVW